MKVLEVTKRPRWGTLRRWRLGTTAEGTLVPEELGAGAATPYSSLTNTVEFLEHWGPTHVSYLIVGAKLDHVAQGAGITKDIIVRAAIAQTVGAALAIARYTAEDAAAGLAIPVRIDGFGHTRVFPFIL